MNLELINKGLQRAVMMSSVAWMVAGVQNARSQEILPSNDSGELVLVAKGESTHENTLVGQAEGFFPTQDDLLYLADRDYPRGMNSHQGPDAELQGATGIFPYDRQDNSIYSQHRNILAPVDRFLGFFGPQDTLVIESSRLQGASIALDGEIPPLITRTFEPEMAHVKLGPLYFDLLWIGAGAIWTDYSPYGSAQKLDTDDTAAYIDFAIRGYLRITETFYISALGNFIYLPLENELGFGTSLDGGGGPVFTLNMHWQGQAGSWEFLLLDTFAVHPGLNYDLGLDDGQDGVDFAGRYSFGFYSPERSSRFDVRSDDAWISNQILGRASSLVFTEDWRLSLQADHTDFWRTFSFEDHAYRDHFGALLGYEGNVIPFAPVLTYDASTSDHETYRHEVMLGFRGRITENINTAFGGGYLWETGDEAENESWLWYVSLNHTISEGIAHGVSFGQNIFEDAFSPETVYATYARYYIALKITHQLSLTGVAQWEQSERLERRSGDRFNVEEYDRYSYGAYLSYRPLGYTNITASAVYETNEVADGVQDTERWLYRLNVIQRLTSRLTLEGYYQYEDAEFEGGGFDEHLVGLSIRRYF
ncbi:hypothetical protein FEM03_18050 [Phragmitibacter flavus]|uniref:TIGR03016 family PEP-CTERM system-associated outer membrane protein n=1 Tax=Phragmitibacter flavus TaxID=2576071 RepID=A0A5R8KBH9_9BACT|nr:hypothetical protein [Phragmitibacter flavus]TLD69275.1 hypothetical protein FEM03_18050 [Phragmitibacter flavus]